MKYLACLVSLVLVGSLVLGGCATIATGTSQTISITSNVDGAQLFLDGQLIGTTPFHGTVKKNKKVITIEKEGYRSEKIVLSKTLEGAFWGNIIIGGTVGSITDFASGGAYTYAPATYQIDLKDNSQTALGFELELAVRKFSMIYIDDISRDLASGQGEYLSALIALVNTENSSPRTISNVRTALEASGGNHVEFGAAMVALI